VRFAARLREHSYYDVTASTFPAIRWKIDHILTYLVLGLVSISQHSAALTTARAARPSPRQNTLSGQPLLDNTAPIINPTPSQKRTAKMCKGAISN